MNESKVILVYIGSGSALIGVPARDLTEADFAERAELWQELGWNEESLVGTGLYQYAIETARAEKTPRKSKVANFE